MKHPGQFDLRRGGGMRVRHVAESCDQIAGALEVVRKEERVGCPDAVVRQARAVMSARQQPLCQRAAGDHNAAVRLGER